MNIELAMTLEEQRAYPKKYPTAGKPKKANKKVSLTIRIKPELLKQITGNRSAFIESAIEEQLIKNTLLLNAIKFVDKDSVNQLIR